jgi:hypothetical protein
MGKKIKLDDNSKNKNTGQTSQQAAHNFIYLDNTNAEENENNLASK